jgi:hypothetical protein
MDGATRITGLGWATTVSASAATLLIWGSVDVVARAQPPSRDELVAKMGAYIAGLVSNLSSVVAEEEYRQDVSSPSRRRDLKSDLLLVPYPGASRLWVSFRDVLAVDGKSVHDDRTERLTALFLRPPEDAARRAREISAASDKYDIARVTPFDDPFLALSLLQSAYQPRFRFGRLGLDRKLGPRMRILEFEEVQRPSLIRNGINELLTSGLVWTDEESGKVLKTELRTGSGTFPLRVTTTFAFDDRLGCDVPVLMEGWFPGPIHNVTIRATYGQFRRFQVRTTETLR